MVGPPLFCLTMPPCHCCLVYARGRSRRDFFFFSDDFFCIHVFVILTCLCLCVNPSTSRKKQLWNVHQGNFCNRIRSCDFYPRGSVVALVSGDIFFLGNFCSVLSFFLQGFLISTHRNKMLEWLFRVHQKNTCKKKNGNSTFWDITHWKCVIEEEKNSLHVWNLYSALFQFGMTWNPPPRPDHSVRWHVAVCHRFVVEYCWLGVWDLIHVPPIVQLILTTFHTTDSQAFLIKLWPSHTSACSIEMEGEGLVGPKRTSRNAFRESGGVFPVSSHCRRCLGKSPLQNLRDDVQPHSHDTNKRPCLHLTWSETFGLIFIRTNKHQMFVDVVVVVVVKLPSRIYLIELRPSFTFMNEIIYCHNFGTTGQNMICTFFEAKCTWVFASVQHKRRHWQGSVLLLVFLRFRSFCILFLFFFFQKYCWKVYKTKESAKAWFLSLTTQNPMDDQFKRIFCVVECSSDFTRQRTVLFDASWILCQITNFQPADEHFAFKKITFLVYHLKSPSVVQYSRHKTFHFLLWNRLLQDVSNSFVFAFDSWLQNCRKEEKQRAEKMHSAWWQFFFFHCALQIIFVLFYILIGTFHINFWHCVEMLEAKITRRLECSDFLISNMSARNLGKGGKSIPRLGLFFN